LSKRRHKNPAAKPPIPPLNAPAKAPAAALEALSGKKGKFWPPVAAAVLSPLLLLAAFAPLDMWPLAYVALAIWAWGILTVPRRALPLAYVSGAVFWFAGVYWLSWVTVIGYIASSLYLSLYWLAAGAMLRGAWRRKWPLWLVLPVVWVALEYVREFVASGFPWFQLAHSQYRLTPLLQIVDITGQYGVSFFVALVNGAILHAILRRPAQRPYKGWASLRPLAPAAVAAMLLAGMLGYGFFRLGQKTTCPGPTVGLVQEAFPNALDRRGASREEVYDAYLNASRELVGKGCDLVVWPETMLYHHDMDPAVWIGLDPNAADPQSPGRPRYSPEFQDMIRDYQAAIGALSQLIVDLGCPLLAGDSMPGQGALAKRDHLMTNSAVLFEKDSALSCRITGRYAKTHMVPFGEYVPGAENCRPFYEALRQFVPGVMCQLQPGCGPVRFEAPCRSGRGTFSFATPICYEGVFARVCRELALGGPSKVDMLINISNDGWFIWDHSAAGEISTSPTLRADVATSVHASSELDQHLAQYVFRAIENRLPVLRSVNCGISAGIDSNGRIVSVLQRDGRRKMIAGTLICQTLVDDRISIYSQTGDIFAQGFVCAGFAAAAWMLVGRYLGKKDRQV
jgi:apolipoprotein N-acyltransferase